MTDTKLKKNIAKLARTMCEEAGLGKVNVGVIVEREVTGWPRQIVIEVRRDIDPSSCPEWVYN